MNEEQAKELWSALLRGWRDSDVTADFGAREGYPSRRTIQRFVQVHKIRSKPGATATDVENAGIWRDRELVDQVNRWWDNWQQLATPEKPISAGRSVSEDSHHAEASGHWPGLRDTARRLGLEVSGGAPFPQLLGFRWSTSFDQNGALKLTSGRSSIRYALNVESTPLMGSLWEHLEDGGLKDLLARWVDKIPSRKAAIDDVVLRVKASELLRGYSKVDVDPEPEAKGITDWFVRTAVLWACEDRCERRRPNGTIEIETIGSKATNVLMLHREEGGYAPLAFHTDQKKLDGLLRDHAKLVEVASFNINELGLPRAHKDFMELGRRVIEVTERVAAMAVFTGRCYLYPT